MVGIIYKHLAVSNEQIKFIHSSLKHGLVTISVPLGLKSLPKTYAIAGAGALEPPLIQSKGEPRPQLQMRKFNWNLTATLVFSLSEEQCFSPGKS